MQLQGDLAQAQFPSGLLVHQAAADELHHLQFARCQCRMAIDEPLDYGPIRPLLAVVFERAGDGVEHVPVAKRLREAVGRACAHGTNGHRDVAVAGDGDDRGAVA